MRTLEGSATAQLFCSMMLAAQEASPVDSLAGFEARSRDLLTDLRSCLESLPDTAAGSPYSTAQRYCDAALGDYEQDPVALTMQRILEALEPAFAGTGVTAPEAMRQWLQEYGAPDHTLAWLAAQTTNQLVAGATSGPMDHQ
ncbi:MAG: hypothetical protein ACYCSH_10255 [Acidithiobacillus sp.]